MILYPKGQVLSQICYLKIGDRCVIRTKKGKFIGEFRGTSLPNYFSANRYYIIKTNDGKIKHIVDDSIISIKNCEE